MASVIDAPPASNTLFNTSPLVKTYTLEEFWALPDPPDRLKLELIAGVLYMTPPPEETHDDSVSRLYRLLTLDLADAKDRGRVYVPRAAIWTSKRTYLEPDLFYVSAELMTRLAGKRRTTADLVVEVISPGSAIYDRHTKKDTYAALGVRELWLVDETAETVDVLKLAGKRYDEGQNFQGNKTIVSAVLPRVTFTAAQLFTD